MRTQADGAPANWRRRLYVLVLADCLAMAVAFGLLTDQASQPQLVPMDRGATAWLRDYRADWPLVTDLAHLITVVGNTSVATVIVMATFATWYTLAQAGYVRFRLREASYWLGAILVGRLLCSGIKQVLKRERPPSLMRLVDETTYSFPSGHANFAALAFGFCTMALLRLIPKRYVLARWTAVLSCLLATLLVAGSRVWLGAHYPTDVLAGYLLGLTWFLLSLMLATQLGLHEIIDPTTPPKESGPSA
ncbi:phosphatase PAP2 family protein [Isosphaeraceae bacterium EP7]